MRFRLSKYCRVVIFLLIIIICLNIFLSFNKPSRQDDCMRILQEHSMRKVLPFRMFNYPLDIDFKKLEENITIKGRTNIEPINVYQFSYKKPMEHVCDSTATIFLLFMIKSAPGDFDQRQAIRGTWANKLYFQNDVIRHVFLVARTMNETIYNQIQLEGEIHHDIVEMTHIDDYYNSTYKTIGGINWYVKYCPTAQFVMLVDDDMYVATDLILEYLHRLPREIYRTFFLGSLLLSKPQRCPEDKWLMSLEDYPFEVYPLFVSGGAIVLSMDFAKRLHIAIPFTKWFKFDDVFLAIVAFKLSVKPINHPEFHVRHGISYEDVKFKTTLVSHGYGEPNMLKAAWYLHISRQTYKGNTRI